ncbi:MAG TPA: SPOR domain-containing protein [Bacteroidales bacterium]
MELAIYIKNLLYNHHKVIIPGLGELQTIYKSAEIDSTGGTISPPSKTLIFSSKAVNSDDLLVNHIADQKAIDKTEAEKFISSQVQLLYKKLNTGETVLLDGIGYFSKKDDIIRFDPEQGLNYLTNSFGLSKVDYKPVEHKAASKHTEPVQSPPRRRSYTYVFLFLAIVVVIGGGVGAYFYFPGIAGKLKNIFKSSSVTQVTQKTNVPAVAKKDTAKESNLEKVVDESTDKKKALAIKSDSSTHQLNENIAYYIIAGSFKTFERASVLAKQLKKEGYTPEVLQFDQDLYRVSLGEFKEKTEAITRLDKIKAAKGPDAVWLLTKKM